MLNVKQKINKINVIIIIRKNNTKMAKNDNYEQMKDLDCIKKD